MTSTSQTPATGMRPLDSSEIDNVAGGGGFFDSVLRAAAAFRSGYRPPICSPIIGCLPGTGRLPVIKPW